MFVFMFVSLALPAAGAHECGEVVSGVCSGSWSPADFHVVSPAAEWLSEPGYCRMVMCNGACTAGLSHRTDGCRLTPMFPILDCSCLVQSQPSCAH